MDEVDQKVLSFLADQRGFSSMPDCTRTYQTSVHRADGSDAVVTVTLHDRGSAVHPEERFRCEASADDGKGSSGNVASSALHAVAMVHWQSV